MVPKIWTGTLVHNRPEILKEFLDCLEDVVCDGHLFYLNNCDEETTDLISQFPKPKWVVTDNELPSFSKRLAGRQASLAVYRNRMLKCAFDILRADYLLSVDSDIMVDNAIVQDLLSQDEDIIAALVRNDQFHWNTPKNAGFAFNIMDKVGPEIFGRVGLKPQAGKNPCGLTGAVYLIHKDVYHAGVRYHDHTQGEDAGFCLHALDEGFQPHYLGDRVLPHLMTEELLKEWQESKNRDT